MTTIDKQLYDTEIIPDIQAAIEKFAQEPPELPKKVSKKQLIWALIEPIKEALKVHTYEGVATLLRGKDIDITAGSLRQIVRRYEQLQKAEQTQKAEQPKRQRKPRKPKAVEEAEADGDEEAVEEAEAGSVDGNFATDAQAAGGENGATSDPDQSVASDESLNPTVTETDKATAPATGIKKPVKPANRK